MPYQALTAAVSPSSSHRLSCTTSLVWWDESSARASCAFIGQKAEEKEGG